jgi:hypothetical protein
MSAKRGSLSALTVKHAPPVSPPEPQPPEIMADPPLRDLEERKVAAVYLSRATWRQLRDLGEERRMTQHDLMLEGLKLLFRANGIDPGLVVGGRPSQSKKASS